MPILDFTNFQLSSSFGHSKMRLMAPNCPIKMLTAAGAITTQPLSEGCNTSCIPTEPVGLNSLQRLGSLKGEHASQCGLLEINGNTPFERITT